MLAGVSLTVLTAFAQSGGNDWPQWRGPNRDGVSKETGLLKSWPAGGPKLLWKATGLGEGHSTPSVAAGRIYGMGLRGDDEVVWALDAATGKMLWSTRIAAGGTLGGSQGGYGSRSTPTIDGDRAYVVGVQGELACLQVSDGKLLWQKNFVREFGGRVPSWGYSESPLVDGNKVIATPGGSQGTIVAFNKLSGDVVWKTLLPEGDAEKYRGGGYASPIVATVGGQRQYVQFLGGGVVGVAAQDGRFLWRYTSPANRTANIPTPIFRDNAVFAASGYNTGGGLAKLVAGAGGTTVQEVYFTRQMQNHHGGVILVGDYLYGFDGSNLTCLNFQTGEPAWSNRSVGKGSLVYADGMLYARSEQGTVGLVEATPTAYVEKGRFEQPERSKAPSWPHPVVANGRLYLHDQDILLCYDVKAGG